VLARIHLEDVGVRRGGAELFRVPRLAIESGRILAILGANGSGKTTLLRLLAGLERDFSGDIHYDAEPHAVYFQGRNRPGELLLLAQEPVLFDTPVERNLAYGLRLQGRPHREIQDRVAGVLGRLGLEGLAKRRATRLSGGEKRRVALARVLTMEPRFLLLDEPFADVDPRNRELLESILQEEARGRGAGVVFTTHQEDIAVRRADEIVQICQRQLAPYHPRNVLRGVPRREGRQCFFQAGAVRIEIPPFAQPPDLIHIPPTDIVLSREYLHATARNQLRGTIRTTRQADQAVDVLVDCGVELEARITLQSLQEHRLVLGDFIYLSFKTSAVRFL
jgi:molybdopterin-binding protein